MARVQRYLIIEVSDTTIAALYSKAGNKISTNTCKWFMKLVNNHYPSYRSDL